MEDLRVALLLLLVSRVVKDEGALTEAGGPSLFVDLLEDNDACIRHAAATFLEVGPSTQPCTQAARPHCRCHLKGQLPCNLQAQAASWLGQFPCLHPRLAGTIMRAYISSAAFEDAGVALDQLCSCFSFEDTWLPLRAWRLHWTMPCAERERRLSRIQSGRVCCAGALRGESAAGVLPGRAAPGGAGAAEPRGRPAAQQVPPGDLAAEAAVCGPRQVILRDPETSWCVAQYR